MHHYIAHYLLPVFISLSVKLNYWQDRFTLYFAANREYRIVWYQLTQQDCVECSDSDDLESLLAEIDSETPKYITINEFPELGLFLQNYANNYHVFQDFLKLHFYTPWHDGDIFTDIKCQPYRFAVQDGYFYFDKLKDGY
jgi:hypothetical protein